MLDIIVSIFTGIYFIGENAEFDDTYRLSYNQFVSIVMGGKYYIKPHNFIH